MLCHDFLCVLAGNIAAMDMDNPESVVSPGGVGFDINCGVRLLRTNLTEKDVTPIKEQLTQLLFDHIPVGVGSKGMIPMTERDLEEALEMGIDWSLREGYAWIEDKEHCFAPQTEVLLANGLRCAIGDCAVGDRLVDEHGNARTITRHSSGEGLLYEVVCSKDPVSSDVTSRFVCNGGHQLVVYFGSVVILTLHEDVRFYCVSYHKVSFDEVLGFSVPTGDSAIFPVEALAAAEAFAKSIPSHWLWEPTVAQYRAFVARYPSRQQWCHMMRAAPTTLPELSPFLSFSQLLESAHASTATASDAHHGSDALITPVEAAYMFGHWLGGGYQPGACLSQAPELNDAVDLSCRESCVNHGFGETISGNFLASEAFVRVLRLLMVFGSNKGKIIGDAAEQAFLSDSLDVRVSLLAGLIDNGGFRRGSGWTLAQNDDHDTTDEHVQAQFVWRVALSIGFCATLHRGMVHIKAPSDVGGDILSPCLKCEHKRVPLGNFASEEDSPEKRWPRGAQLYPFSVFPAGTGRFISMEVDGPNHRFLLADYLVVHNCEEFGRMLQADSSKVSDRAKKRGLPQVKRRMRVMEANETSLY